jgi:HlyD family secretion protein
VYNSLSNPRIFIGRVPWCVWCLWCLWWSAFVLTSCGGGDAPGEIRVAGHVEATEVRVSTKLGGTLERLSADEGDRVEAGRELARFSSVDQQLALRAAAAERDLATAQLRLLTAGFRAEEVAEAAAQVARARVDLAAAERDRERFDGLLAAGSGTAKSRDDARARRDLAARTLEAAEQRQRKFEAGFRPEEIDAARARVAVADARIAGIEQQIADATVLAPAAGTVTAKLVEQGEILPPGTPLLVITDLADARLIAWIGEADLGRIRIGQEVDVHTDDGGQRTGRVCYVSPTAEFTPKNVQTRDERVKLVFRVKIELENDDGLYKPGMPAEAVLRDGTS